MTTKEIVKFLENNHASDIIEYKNPANWIESGIICTATTQKHISMLIDEFKDEFGKGKIDVDGEHSSSWAIINIKNTIIHIFNEEARQYYMLDHLWQNSRIN